LIRIKPPSAPIIFLHQAFVGVYDDVNFNPARETSR